MPKSQHRQLDAPPSRSGIPDPLTQPVLTAEAAFAELGIDRGTGYKAIRDGTFPVPVIRVGRLIRVPTAALRRLLVIDDEGPSGRVPSIGPDDSEIRRE